MSKVDVSEAVKEIKELGNYAYETYRGTHEEFEAENDTRAKRIAGSILATERARIREAVEKLIEALEAKRFGYSKSNDVESIYQTNLRILAFNEVLAIIDSKPTKGE